MSLALNIIYAARRLLALGHAEIAREQGHLSQSELSVLLSVYDRPGLTAKSLAERLSRDKTTVSRAVSRLTEQGLVQSETSILDGRRRDLSLTDEGNVIAQQAANRMREETEGLTDQMTPEHVEMVGAFVKDLGQDKL